MQDKDKLFLIVYFGVKNRPMDMKTNQIMLDFYERLNKSLDDTIKTYIVPDVTTDRVKFEMLNVEKVSDERIEEITELYNKILDEFRKDKK